MKIHILILALAIITGCSNTVHTIDDAVGNYERQKHNVRLGMDYNDFYILFAEYEDLMPRDYKKTSKRFTRDNAIYDVVFVRSDLVEDGETTDDEFTPYVFREGKLVSIGWDSIGGEQRTSYDIVEAEAAEKKRDAEALAKVAAACAAAGGRMGGSTCYPAYKPTTVEMLPMPTISTKQSITCTSMGNTTTCR